MTTPELLTVVMPVYNELATLRRALDRLLAVELPIPTEILRRRRRVHRRCLDTIADLDRGRPVRLIRQDHNQGKGAALRPGIDEAEGDLLTILDADLEYDPADFRRCSRPIIAGETTVVYGARSFGGHAAYSFWYVIGNKAWRSWRQPPVRRLAHRLETCLKVAPTDALAKAELRSGGFGIEAEITGKFLRSGRAHLRGADLLQGAGPRGGQEDQVDRRGGRAVDPPPRAGDRSMTTWRAEVDAHCTICRGTDRQPVHVIDGHRIVRCGRCRHLYVSPRPAMEDVVAIYGADYFENPAFQTTNHDGYFGYMDYLNDRENIQIRLHQVLTRIGLMHPPGRLLDVGCGPGLFLEVGDKLGWDSWGIDLNASAIDWARENVSANVRVGTVADLGAEPESFACITMFDVIEHLADPREELQEVWRLLEPGGILVVVTPDAGAPMSRLLGKHWLEMKRAPEHLQFFSVPGLAKLLDLCGFSSEYWHTIGKVTTMHNILADLRFYSDRLFGGIDKVLGRLGVADRVFDVDPHTKLCLYARKTGSPAPIQQFDTRAAPTVPKVRTARISSRDVVAARARGATARGPAQPEP